MPWNCQEPFLFCVHHQDHYPKGTPSMSIDPSHLRGRDIGSDFTVKDGFRMYHGKNVPGFPYHPHRGFETITIVLDGFIDHSDSLGATARYGIGDVQWMCAGRGTQHSEMFPLLNTQGPNELHLFQIWLNLPAAGKNAEPDFKMFWDESIPVIVNHDKKFKLKLIAGEFEDKQGLEPPKASWASRKDTDTQIWLFDIEPNGEFEIPKAILSSAVAVPRSLFFYDGDVASIDSHEYSINTGFFIDSSQPLTIKAMGQKTAKFLLLQSKAIGEPVVSRGPFVMNTDEEIAETWALYQRTQFGGWPHTAKEMVHDKLAGRFAKFPDGTIDKPTEQGNIPV